MPPKKQPLLDRVYTRYWFSDNPVRVLPLEKKRIPTDYDKIFAPTPEGRTLDILLNDDNAYIDAGTLPEVVIRPPKDNAVYKANYMIPNKQLRNSFYDDTYSDKDASGFIKQNTISQRDYVNRLWNLYKKSSEPTIKSVYDRSSTIPILQKIGLMEGDDTRANYNPFTNTMYIDPDFAANDIEAEISHAYQMRGTDTPRSWQWMKQFLSRPNGDIKINGVNGYNTPGSTEFIAHRIIEPIFHDYLNSNGIDYSDVYKTIQDVYNNQDSFFKTVTDGPFKGNIISTKYNNLRNALKKKH